MTMLAPAPRRSPAPSMPEHPKHRFRTWIEIDRARLAHNLRELVAILQPGTDFMAVVKSNAYGHGIVDIAKAISALYPRAAPAALRFGTDSIVEAVRLRMEGIDEPMLVLGYTLPSRFAEAASRGIAITVSSFESLRALAAGRAPVAVHLKFDTGMHRQGFYAEELGELERVLARAPHLTVEGVLTHYAMATDRDRAAFTERQHAAFTAIAREVRRHHPRALVHSANTGATLLFADTHADLVRVGIGLYGYYPSPEARRARARQVRLQPILSWRSQVSELKRVPRGHPIGYDLTEVTSRAARVAVVPIGYWHGYDRGLSSRGRVLVRGRYARVLGRVSMDMITIDVTSVPGVAVGDVVTILGADGSREVTADEMATAIDTSAYEVLTRINPLIHKAHLG